MPQPNVERRDIQYLIQAAESDLELDILSLLASIANSQSAIAKALARIDRELDVVCVG